MGAYNEDISKMDWSYSRLTSFEQCKYSFYLGYILRDFDLYPSESNYYAEVGIFVHDILAMVFEGQLNLDEAAEYFVNNYDRNIFHKVKESTMEGIFEKCANFFANADLKWLDDYEVLGVELKTRFKIDKYDCIGFIDLLLRDKRDGRIVILDNKSSEYPFRLDGAVKYNSKETFQKYKKQMYIYSIYVKETYNEYPKEIVWHHFKYDGKLATITFSEDEYNNAKEWILETIHNIEDEEEYGYTQEFFYCSTLCDFRSTCEYREREIWKKRYSHE